MHSLCTYLSCVLSTYHLDYLLPRRCAYSRTSPLMMSLRLQYSISTFPHQGVTKEIMPHLLFAGYFLLVAQLGVIVLSACASQLVS